jgi:PAS domain S-box-containing protein
MTDAPFDSAVGSVQERLEQLAHRGAGLPTEARELVDELLELYGVSIEELRVAAEELHQQNQELLATHEEVEAQHRHYQDLFESAPDGYVVTDSAGLIEDANRAAVDLLAVSKVQLLGKPLVLYIAPGERDRFHRNLDRLVEGRARDGREVEWEMHIQPRRGPAFPAALTVARVRGVQGELTGLRWLLRDITASKRAKEREWLLGEARAQRRAAEEANRLLLALIDTMPIGALISDADGNLVRTNAAGQAILGAAVRGTVASPERLFTTHYPNGSPLPPEEMPLMHALREGGVVRDFEMLIRQPDGEERTLLAGAAPVLDEAGKIVSGIAIFQDITERKETRRVLQLYANRLHILHSAGQSILTGESADEIVGAVLPFVRELVRCRRASVLGFDQEAGEAMVLGVHSDGETQLGKGTWLPLDAGWPLEVLAEGRMGVVEDVSALDVQPELLEALQSEGVRFVVNVPLMAQGELMGAVNLGFEEPVTLSAEHREIIRQMADELAIGLRQIRLHEEVQRHAERLEKTVARRTAALRASEARFRAIFEDSVLGIALLDPKGEIVACNPALQAMMGYTEEELCSTRFTDYSHPDDIEADKDLYQTLASGDLGYYQVEKRYVPKDGQVHWSEFTVSRVEKMKRDRPWLAIAMMEDITEKRMNREALLRAERLAIAGRLGASLAHEINNPLQSVIGCLGLAEELLDDGEEVRRYLEIAMEELERAADIVTQLRDLSRESKAKMESADLNALVEKVLLLTRKRCENRRVDVAWSPATDLPAVPLARDRVQQVFLNLVLNAVEAMPEGGRLRVSTAPTSEPEGVRVTFADTGVGIEPKRLPRIFEPFHSSRLEGLGLGLYITKNIVREHGGHIGVDSQLGEGTTFTVWLPTQP